MAMSDETADALLRLAAERLRLEWLLVRTHAEREVPGAGEWEGGTDADWFEFLRGKIDAAIEAEGEAN